MRVEASFRAFAKINLDLRVLGKRPDGYHELRTVFQTISLADRIRVRYEPSSETSLTTDSSVPIEDNLITRAARLVLEELRCGGHFRFRLHKRIPLGAGLGGGSADAAAILRNLPKLLERSIPPERLHAMATCLGSDVPFFLCGGTAVGLGRGDELYPLPDFPPLRGLLVKPKIHVSTAEAYRALAPHLADASPDRKRTEFVQFAWTEALSTARNDFEAPVFALHPELRMIREELEAAGALPARMTGSGSALFGLFADVKLLARAQQRLTPMETIRFSFVNRRRYQALVQVQPINDRAGQAPLA